jgi:DNA-binding NtrC family response regulator
MRQAILIVDDKQDMLKLLERIIKADLDVDVYTADSGNDALEVLMARPVSVVLADVKMPGMDGIELLRRIKKLNETIVVIMMTAYGTVESAVESLKLGAYDFVAKPFDEERLLHTIKLALERYSLIRKNLTLEQRLKEQEAVERFVGQSPPVQKLVDAVRLVAKTDVTVLITGETGTGKDLAAKTIHALSSRSDKPFVAVNCPAIPENILESELFGYKKGAFTGATQDREGLFQTAHGGTILLDEIGDISPVLQAKLLRVLQEKEMKPLGDTRTQKVDVRIIASTNQNLKEKIAADQFREDLYYRLNVVSIHTPSLKEIQTDIPLLANHFLAHFCSDFCVPQKRFSEEALRVLVARKWSGNVRELQNVIKRSVIFSTDTTILPEDFSCEAEALDALIPEDSGRGMCDHEYKDARKSILEKFNVQYITTLLRNCDGNVTVASKKAGLERQSLQHLARKYGIHAEEFRKGANKT